MMADRAQSCRYCGAMLDEGRTHCPSCNAAVRKGRGFFRNLFAILTRPPFPVETPPDADDEGHRGERLPTVGEEDQPATLRDVDQIEIRQPDGTVRTFDSLDDVPGDVRDLLQRHMAQAAARGGVFGTTTHTTTTTVRIIDENGVRRYEYDHTGDDGVKRTYHSLDDMPPHVRDLFDKDGDNRPDLPGFGD